MMQNDVKTGEAPRSSALLTPLEMQDADRLTIAAGTSGIALMERAGQAVATLTTQRYPAAKTVALLAGPGNNGGDAFVAARLLREAGRSVRLYLLGSRDDLRGDAALAASSCPVDAEPLRRFDPDEADVVIDGLFGAGLARAIEGEAAAAIETLNASNKPVVAIDLPSGVSGLSGETLGIAVRSRHTVTFFRRKPGHLLQPGRTLCGETIVAGIGIDPTVLDRIAPRAFANEPALWLGAMPWPDAVGHKYDRGHAVVFSGGTIRTGAARMTAAAALRVGAGLVTLYSPAAALLVNASHLTAIMLDRCDDSSELAERLADERLNTFAIGPGFGIGPKAVAFALAVLEAGRHLVIDADAITSFKAEPDRLMAAIRGGKGQTVLTPHGGEFVRLFPDIAAAPASKLERVRQAAERAGAVIVLKGSDTVVAAPDGRASISGLDAPYLATAGTGDVLAGMITGLLAQRMPAFEAASAAVWIHAEAGRRSGPGLIAEDLPTEIVPVLRGLRDERLSPSV